MIASERKTSRQLCRYVNSGGLPGGEFNRAYERWQWRRHRAAKASSPTSNARRLCPLDTNVLQYPNSPGTEELPR